MARQIGTYCITGSRDNLCFYTMEGKHYVRLKSSLTGQRVKKDPAFKTTMQYAGLLGSASKIASMIYRTLPKEEKIHQVYRKLTGQAMRLLKEGVPVEAIFQILASGDKQVKRQASNSVDILKPTRQQLYADIIIAKAFEGSLEESTGFVFCSGREAPT